MAFKTFTDGAILTAADVNTYLARQAIIVCTSTTRPSSPNEGMTCYETDTNTIRTYDGSLWQRAATLGYPAPWFDLTLPGGCSHNGGFNAGVRMRSYNTVELRGGIKKTTAGVAFASGTQIATLPNASYNPPHLLPFICPAERESTLHSVRIEITTAGAVMIYFGNGGGTYTPEWVEFNGAIHYDLS